MVCPNCGTDNFDESAICTKCGTTLKGQIKRNDVDNGKSLNQNSTIQNSVNKNSNTGTFGFFSYILGSFFKPFEYFNLYKEKLSSGSTAFVLSLIVSGLFMIITFMKSLINPLFYSYGYSINDSLLNYQGLITFGIFFLIYFGTIFTVAIVYFVVGLFFNREVKFKKILAASATSLIPFAFMLPFASIVRGTVGIYLLIILGFFTMIYSLLVCIFLMTDDLSFDTVDSMILYNALSLSIIFIIAYFVLFPYFFTFLFLMFNI